MSSVLGSSVSFCSHNCPFSTTGTRAIGRSYYEGTLLVVMALAFLFPSSAALELYCLVTTELEDWLDLYDSWKSRMKLYMQNREHGRMILESIEHGPLIWPTIEENGVTRTKKYAELSTAEKIQVDCDMKATNIILQGLAVPVFSLRDNPIACLNKVMAFLTAVASSRGDKGKVILVLVIRVMLQVLGETIQVDRQGLLNATTVKVKDIWLGNALSLSDQGMQHDIRIKQC
ncbi:hypothetical protein Tco_1334866 [Tanacetum coccineum]